MAILALVNYKCHVIINHSSTLLAIGISSMYGGTRLTRVLKMKVLSMQETKWKNNCKKIILKVSHAPLHLWYLKQVDIDM